jgi:predicted small integral membrane protein
MLARGEGDMTIRISKILLVVAVGALILLVAVNNVLDYDTNYDVVSHVMSMDETPADSAVAWRAITSPALHRLFYAVIITTEFAAAALSLFGAWKLWRAQREAAARFNAAKDVAIAGLALALGLYLFGFMAVGGEWFQMWRSATYNMQQPAFRFIGSVGLVLIFLAQRDE